MSDKKYGFIYLWRDKKHNRFYIGCHWGKEDDGYICSSNWMRDSYKRRPQDFKRRILERVQDRKMLLEYEYYWLHKIPDYQLGKRYYNLSNKLNSHWTVDKTKRITIGQKISAAHKANPNWGQWAKGKQVNEETKQKLRKANMKQYQDQKYVEFNRQTALKQWSDPEYRRIQTLRKVGRKQTKEHIRKRQETIQLNHPHACCRCCQKTMSIYNLNKHLAKKF